jgi:hypothetical protein
MPVIAVGDFNTDNDTVSGNDQLGYQALIDGGLIELSDGPTAPDAPFSCCLADEGLQKTFSAGLPDFDHQVDHVFTTDPDVDPVSTKVVGKSEAVRNDLGIWPSDHAGLVTKLHFPTP